MSDLLHGTTTVPLVPVCSTFNHFLCTSECTKCKYGIVHCKISSVALIHSGIGQIMENSGEFPQNVSSEIPPVWRDLEMMMMKKGRPPAVRMEGMGAATCGFANLIGGQV